MARPAGALLGGRLRACVGTGAKCEWGGMLEGLGGEMFWAEGGEGAWLNGKKISVSKTATLQESLTGTGFPSQKRHSSPNVYFYQEITLRSHGVRRAGSAGLDLAYVAWGRMDGFWGVKMETWETAAGGVVVGGGGGGEGGLLGVRV